MKTATSFRKPSTPQEAGLPSSVWVIIALLLTSVYWAEIKQLVPGLAEPPAVQPLGNVIDSTFIGGFGTRTQVNTTSRALLLTDAVELDKGTLVERRSTVISEQLCVTGTNRCHDIVSR